jgi:nicotinamidase/pyrazinamidase
MRALLLIDIQNDFLPGGALPVPEGDAIIPVVNHLTRSFPLVAATQDWHPRGHSSFASSHAGKKPFDTLTKPTEVPERSEGNERGSETRSSSSDRHIPGERKQTLWPDHCVQGSAGAGFPSSLDLRPAEAIFRKGTDPLIDSYSAFFDMDHRKSTGLAGFLREKTVTAIYLTGLAGDICVFETAMDGLREGFETYFIQDATRPLDAANAEKVLKQFTSAGGKIVLSEELL